MKYEAPELTRFGTFRELTLDTKTQIGGDLTPGWTGGLDCGGTYGCRS
jgi:hypothetical protein